MWPHETCILQPFYALHLTSETFQPSLYADTHQFSLVRDITGVWSVSQAIFLTQVPAILWFGPLYLHIHVSGKCGTAEVQSDYLWKYTYYKWNCVPRQVPCLAWHKEFMVSKHCHIWYLLNKHRREWLRPTWRKAFYRTLHAAWTICHLGFHRGPHLEICR